MSGDFSPAFVVVKVIHRGGYDRQVSGGVHATVDAAQRVADRDRQYVPGDYVVCELVPVAQP